MIELYNDPVNGRNLLPEELEAQRKWAAEHCCLENKISDCGVASCGAEHKVVEGKYSLIISSYKTKPGFGNVTSGEIFCEERLIATIYRNYGDFWYHFIINHSKTGHDYLLCGEDYQGYNVVNLSTGANHVYIPKAALEGVGWCIIGVDDYDPESCELLVDGCFWACPYEQIKFDFSNPEQLPLPVLDIKEL